VAKQVFIQARVYCTEVMVELILNLIKTPRDDKFRDNQMCRCNYCNPISTHKSTFTPH
jgi:hypothetical protein